MSRNRKQKVQKIAYFFQHSENDIDKCLSIVAKQRGETKAQTLKKLFDSIQVKSALRPEYLSGVSHFSMLKGTVGGEQRKILLLYDFHHRKGECPKSLNFTPVSELIFALLKSDIFIDCFLERSALEKSFIEKALPESLRISEKSLQRLKSKALKGTEMAVVINTLEDCFVPSHRSRCSYPNNRVHFTNIRLFSLMIDYYLSGDEERFHRVIESMTGKKRLSIEDYKKLMLQIALKSKMIRKQWEKGPFKDDWVSHIKLYLDIFVEEDLLIKIYLISSEPEEWEERAVMAFFTPLMDMYLLGRLFKRYDDKKHPFANNSIIYVGAAHAIVYHKYLTQTLGFSEVENDISKKNAQCIYTGNMQYGFDTFFRD